MDRKSIERIKRALQVRHRELQLGVPQTQLNLRSTQHDYGKDEGDRANTSLAREIDLGQKSRTRALLASVDAALKRINVPHSANVSTAGTRLVQNAWKRFHGFDIAARVRN